MVCFNQYLCICFDRNQTIKESKHGLILLMPYGDLPYLSAQTGKKPELYDLRSVQKQHDNKRKGYTIILSLNRSVDNYFEMFN